MKKNPAMLLSTTVVFCLTVLILLYPAHCLYFACNGLNLWFQKMIPALFPFMVLSGIMIRMNLTNSFVKLLKPAFVPVFQVSSHCIYTILIGFLCGFPMGAHVTAQLYERNRLSKKEAEFLLAFCNNIGPVYFLSFALPTIGITQKLPALFGMYGLPLFYGLFLRYTIYRKAFAQKEPLPEDRESGISFLQALDESVMSSLTGITKLGGYMIVFNLLNIVPSLLLKDETVKAVIGCILEITGGLKALGEKSPFFALCLLPFGGLSCIAQTYSMIKDTDLSLKNYVFHKLFLTVFSFFYYFFLVGKAY